MTVGEEVDELILRISKVMEQSTVEAADFVIWKAKKFDHNKHADSGKDKHD